MNKLFKCLFLALITSCNSLPYLERFEGYNSRPKEVEGINYIINNEDSPDTIKKKKGLCFITLEKFDKKGRREKIITLNSKREIIYWIEYKYLKKGRLSEQIFYYKDKSINYSKEFIYDTKKNFVIEKDKRSDLSNRIEYTNIEYNKPILKERFRNNIRIEKTINTYNKNSQKIESNMYNEKLDDKSNSVFSYEYDNHGNKTYSYMNYRNKNILITQLEYDSFNNVTYSISHKVKGIDTILKSKIKTFYIYDKRNNVTKSSTFYKNDDDVIINEFSYKYH